MKTLREYIDQLDEISRRDFLKGAGAAALGAAAGLAGKTYYDKSQEPRNLSEKEENQLLNAVFTLAAYSMPQAKKAPSYDKEILTALNQELNTFVKNNPVISFKEKNEVKTMPTKDYFNDLFKGASTDDWSNHLENIEDQIQLAPRWIMTVKNLNQSRFKESQLEETTDEVDRVVQLAREMR